MQEMSGLHPRLGRNAAHAEARAAELRLLLDAGDLRAQLGCADRCGVAPGTSAKDGDVDFHISSSNLWFPRAMVAPHGRSTLALRADDDLPELAACREAL